MIAPRLFILLAFLCIGPRMLIGQACCSGGAPLSGSIGLEDVEKGFFFTEINYDYNTQKSLVSNSERIGDNPRERVTHSGIARLGFAPTDRFMIVALMSYVQQEERTQLNTGGTSLKKATGVGDAVIMGQYRLFGQLKDNLLIGLGTELPIGRTDRIDERTELPLHPDLQPGRGAWSFIGSMRYNRYQLIRPTTSFFTQLTYRVTTAADRYEGLQEYRFGNEFRIMAGISDRLTLKKSFIDPGILVMYRHTEEDEINGNKSPNTGGNWIHIRPGVQWALSPYLQLGAFSEWPIWWSLKGTQLTTTTRMRISVQYKFPIS